MGARSAAEVGYRSGRCNRVRELIHGPLYQLALLGSSRPRPQAALSRSYTKRKNQRGAGMAATLTVRLTAGIPITHRSRGSKAPEVRHAAARYSDVRLRTGAVQVVDCSVVATAPPLSMLWESVDPVDALTKRFGFGNAVSRSAG